MTQYQNKDVRFSILYARQDGDMIPGTNLLNVTCTSSADMEGDTWQFVFVIRIHGQDILDCYATATLTWEAGTDKFPDVEELQQWFQQEATKGFIEAMEKDDFHEGIFFPELTPILSEVLQNYFIGASATLAENLLDVMDYHVYDNPFSITIAHDKGLELLQITFDLLFFVLERDLVTDGTYFREQLDEKPGLEEYVLLRDKVALYWEQERDLELKGVQYFAIRQFLNLAAWLLCSRHEHKLRELAGPEYGYDQEDFEWYMKVTGNTLMKPLDLDPVEVPEEIVSLIEWQE